MPFAYSGVYCFACPMKPMLVAALALLIVACGGGNAEEAAGDFTGEAFARQIEGRWSGVVQEDVIYPMGLTVTGGVLRTEYPTLPCTGELELVSVDGSTVVYMEKVIEGGDVCLDDISVTLALQSDGRLEARLYLQGGKAVGTALLTRAP